MPHNTKEKRNAWARKRHAEVRDHRNAYMRQWQPVSRNKKQEALAGRPRPEFCEKCGGQGAGRSKSLTTVYDHNHATGKFRGWLCGNCNSILGLAKDNAKLLRELADYIENDGIRSDLALAA